jgi:hypothetical protein
MVTKFIWVTFRKKGMHSYPSSGTDPSLQDVSYLANRHRHLFNFKVGIEVASDSREIEFHQFLNWLESLYDSSMLDLNSKSCEAIGSDLIDRIKEKYPNRSIFVEISEDGECGSTSWYTEQNKHTF